MASVLPPDLATELMQSIAAQRLVIFSGAGLSRAAPSSLPSAWELAQDCSLRHKRQTGDDLPANIRENLEAIAKHFENAGSLPTYFIPKLIDWAPFGKRPNAGHATIADFLSAGVIEFSVTTNVDTLVEVAAESLGEPDFYASLDGNEAAQVRPHRSLLKIHGCYRRDRAETLWCREQLERSPLKERIAASSQWLTGQLMNRDVVFVGYWSDWAYMNDVLAGCVATARPRLVVVVDPEKEAKLAAKARDLWAWANTATGGFKHVQASGAEFLDQLRARYSRTFLDNVVEDGRALCPVLFGTTPTVPLDLAPLSNHELYDMRRRVTGAGSSGAVRHRSPEPTMALPGALMVRLREKGAVLQGADFALGSDRIRVVNAASKPLSSARAEFESEAQPLEDDVLTICAGAFDDGGVPSHLLRGAHVATIVRPGSTGRWMTHEQAITQLGI